MGTCRHDLPCNRVSRVETTGREAVPAADDAGLEPSAGLVDHLGETRLVVQTGGQQYIASNLHHVPNHASHGLATHL